MRAILAMSLAALVAGARPGMQRFEAVEPHMGTLARVTLYAAGEQQAREAFQAAFARIGELDRILSDYRSDSEISRIGRTAAGRFVPVSNDLFTVLRASQELAEETGGAFDITQGPVARLWREARRTAELPARDALREASERSGYRKLELDEARRAVRLATSGMALDVGAIGKGYAASEALEVLRARGVRSALVAISGDLALGDAPPGRRGWRVSLHTDAAHAPAGIPQVLELANLAVSTSGASAQHLDVGGRRYSHVIDPSTGMGLVDDITVTVIARHGLEADGLDTAIAVLGVERGLALVEARAGAAALVVHRTPEGAAVHSSSAFRRLVGIAP